jgi:type IV pilus assembly protein PilV
MLSMNRVHRPPRAQRGFSLIEGLVSILIFSFGVLSLISLETTSIRQSSNAKYRSDASLLANQLIGSMWVSDRTVTTLQNNFATGGASYNTWLASVNAALPGSTASAPTVTVGANGQVTLNLYWLAPNESASAPMHQYTVIAQVQ